MAVKRKKLEDVFTETQVENFRQLIAKVTKSPPLREGVGNPTVDGYLSALLLDARESAYETPDAPDALHTRLKSSPERAVRGFIEQAQNEQRPRRPAQVSVGSGRRVFEGHGHKYNLGDNSEDQGRQ